MIYNIKKRNTPIATLIKNFINKRSGRVTESREEIQKRFDYLDWKDQKKIILAFLDSGKTDRQWAYSKTLDYCISYYTMKEIVHGLSYVISLLNTFLRISRSLRITGITILFA